MWMQLLSLGLAAYGTATKVRADLKVGQAAADAGGMNREASESQAELADFNARVADLQAQDAIERGAQDESRFRQGVRLLIGSQRAGIAASSVDVGYGSAVDVQADATYLGEQDALTIRNNAARAAWGFQIESEDWRKRAEITRKEGVFLEKTGKEQQHASRWQAAGTIIGTSASLLEARYGMKGRT